VAQKSSTTRRPFNSDNVHVVPSIAVKFSSARLFDPGAQILLR
jgi:hypothetical protein